MLDKITILEIKILHLDGEGLAHVVQELSLLRQVLGDLALPLAPESYVDLKGVNQSLWSIEDASRVGASKMQFATRRCKASLRTSLCILPARCLSRMTDVYPSSASSTG